MIIDNQSFCSLGELHQKLEITDLNPKKTLIQVFSGLNSEFEVKQIQSIFKEKNPDINFIGTTTAGEISEGEIDTNTIIVSIIQFENTTVKYEHCENDEDYNLGVEIANSLLEKNTKLFLLFLDGLSTNGSDVADGINSIDKTIPIAGGLAGDNGSFINTFIFNNEIIYSKGCVGVSLNSDTLDIFTDYQLNWQPIGQVMTVTKVNKNRLYEVDGISISDIYKKYLGEKVGDNLPYSATEFPLLKIDEENLEVCRTFVNKFDDGSLLTIGNLEVGDKVRLAFGNVDLILNSTRSKVLKYQQHQPEAIFAYSCTARKSFLQSEIRTELKPLSAIAPMCGYFTYGELFHKDNKNSLLNVSLTVLAMSENKLHTSEIPAEITKELDEFEKNFITNKHFLALEALTTLSNTVINELNETNKELQQAKEELEILATTDKLTGVYNRSKLDEILLSEIDRSKRYDYSFGCAVIDVDYFKHTNDTFGHLVGDEVLKKIAELINTNIRKSDSFGRWGGEEFLLVLPQITKEELENLLEKIRTIISEYEIPNVGNKTISIGASFYQENDTADTIIQRADNGLYQAKHSGRNKVVIV